MSFMTRVRLAVVQWWIRNAKERRRSPAFQDLEGMGRALARPPLGVANRPRAAVPSALPVVSRAADSPPITI